MSQLVMNCPSLLPGIWSGTAQKLLWYLPVAKSSEKGCGPEVLQPQQHWDPVVPSYWLAAVFWSIHRRAFTNASSQGATASFLLAG